MTSSLKVKRAAGQSSFHCHTIANGFLYYREPFLLLVATIVLAAITVVIVVAGEVVASVTSSGRKIRKVSNTFGWVLHMYLETTGNWTSYGTNATA